MTKTGEHLALSAETTNSTMVEPSKGKVALSRPIRRGAPPASTRAASGTGDVTSMRLVDGSGVFTAQQRLQCGRFVRLGIAGRGDLLACRIVVGRLADLTEDAHNHVLEVLLREPRQRERVGGIVD